jgi:glycosyltransferase involved in cell wall biosynthesis
MHLLFAGRLVERKGCAWFIRNVLPLLPAEIALDVAGTVWDEDEGAALRHPRVTHLGPLDSAALADACRSALCVIVPNIEPKSGEFEGFGLVGPEAAAAGGVVVAAATGGLTDSVIDGETGRLVPPGDPAAWAEKIREVAAWTPEARTRFVERAMARAREAFSWPRVADDTIAVYVAAASERKPAS